MYVTILLIVAFGNIVSAWKFELLDGEVFQITLFNCLLISWLMFNSCAISNYSSADGVFFDKAKTTLINYPAKKTTTSYTIPNSVTTIAENAFRGCNYLTSVNMPESLTAIKSSAFYGCSALASITIPNRVSVGTYAFSYCTALTAVYNYISTPGYYVEPSDAFEYVTLANVDLYVPAGSVALYQAADGWKDFRTIQAISSGGGDGGSGGSGDNGSDGATAVASDALPKLAIYPNPAGDMLYITDEFAGVVEIYDLSGTLVLTAASNAINISSLPSGIYIVKAGGRSAKMVKR